MFCAGRYVGRRRVGGWSGGRVVGCSIYAGMRQPSNRGSAGDRERDTATPEPGQRQTEVKVGESWESTKHAWGSTKHVWEYQACNTDRSILYHSYGRSRGRWPLNSLNSTNSLHFSNSLATSVSPSGRPQLAPSEQHLLRPPPSASHNHLAIT